MTPIGRSPRATPRRTPKFLALRYRKNDLAHNVFVSIQRWLRSRGGTAVVMSGIEVITVPEDPNFTYHIAVKVTGRRPTKLATER